MPASIAPPLPHADAGAAAGAGNIPARPEKFPAISQAVAPAVAAYRHFAVFFDLAPRSH
jgi:hypothetical protein